jgi:16S rRNA (cytosine967-C5)-methyltransferase
MENTREIVLDALMAHEKEGIYSNLLIAGVLEKFDYLEQRDKAFIKRLFEGTLEDGIRLDYYLDRVSSVPVRKMKPLIRNVMRMSAYQILSMDQVPDSAAVNEAVRLVRKRKFTNLAGFVNGVLRSLSRQKDTLPLPDRDKEPVKAVSVRDSMPEWIVQLWTDAYGAGRAETICDALREIHPVSIRFRKDLEDSKRESYLEEMKKAGVILEDSPVISSVYLARHVDGIASLPGYAEGAFAVQDASSALAVCSAGIKPGDKVLDACAAPGGKSILAAELADPEGEVLSRDLSPEKTDRIRENAERMQVKNLTVQTWDATVHDNDREDWADVLMLDVPCSGLGILGKKRDIKYRVRPEDFEELRVLQRKILENCWNYVKPGGRLLYSTCTINKTENEEQVRWILEHLPFEQVGESRQLLPGEDPCDGFFFAIFRRKQN